MEAPIPYQFETPNEMKEVFKVSINSNNNNPFDIIVKNYSSYILIIANGKNDLLKLEFSNKYNYDELTKIKYFAGFDSIEEIFEQIKYELTKTNLKLMEEKNLIKIIIPIEMVKIKELTFDLPVKIKTDKEKIDMLISEVDALKKEINELKISHENEIKSLKEENKAIKELFNKYVPYLDELIKSPIEKKDNLSNISLIIKNDIEKENAIINWIKESMKINSLKFKLLFRMSENGSNSSEFHKCCDGVGPTLLLIKTDKNRIFGGFTPLNWGTKNVEVYDKSKRTFIFSLNLMKKFDMIDIEKKSITCKNTGPVFGDWDFGLDYNMKYGSSYANSCSNFLSDNNLELTGGSGDNDNFTTEEFEVYKILY